MTTNKELASTLVFAALVMAADRARVLGFVPGVEDTRNILGANRAQMFVDATAAGDAVFIETGNPLEAADAIFDTLRSRVNDAVDTLALVAGVDVPDASATAIDAAAARTFAGTRASAPAAAANGAAVNVEPLEGIAEPRRRTPYSQLLRSLES